MPTAQDMRDEIDAKYCSLDLHICSFIDTQDRLIKKYNYTLI